MRTKGKPVSKWYRPPKSYVSKNPQKRANSLANLKQNRGKRKTTSKCNMKALAKMDIIKFATEILGISFDERPAQETLLRAQYGLPLSEDQKALYRQLTTNDDVFEDGVEKTEGLYAVGARGGKSTLVSIIALYESICRGHIWRKYVQKGETAYAVITACRQQQAEEVIQANCSRMLEGSKAAYLIKDCWKGSLELTNGITIASYPCSSTAARGLPIFLLIFDEIAHYRMEGPKNDELIYSALRPRQAQYPGAKCFKISTVAGKQGIFWTEFDQGFQVPGRLTVQASTRVVNPVIPQEFIDSEYRRDPDNAAREFGAEFAETVAGFFASCADRLKECFVFAEELPYVAGNTYVGAIDQSGLTGNDRFAFSICHRDTRIADKIEQDVLKVWNARESDVALEEIKRLCSQYHITKVYIDAYAKGWVTDALHKKGLEAEVSERLPVVYANLKTLVLMGRLMLQDRPDLYRGLLETQAWYGKSNTLSIGHERNIDGHGDSADATARAAYYASQEYTASVLSEDEGMFDDDDIFDYDPLDVNELNTGW